MTIELLYTSAAQGLKQGSRGFCTVVSTAGLPINLAQRLEALSGYRHLYQPGDPRADDNPICHSHIRLAVGGKTLSILSRVSAYGVDYSQRTNKIAHHVVLDGPVPSCGPASILLEPGIMRTNWDGECRTLLSGPVVPSLSLRTSPCNEWQRITGDAGWAGVVVNAWLQPAGKPVWIVFSESQSESLLALMQEAIAILPETKRWQATFSTYCTNLPPDVECRVRCVIAGSDEARMSIARGTVLDLTKPIPQAMDSSACRAARTGQVVGSETATQVVPRVEAEVWLPRGDGELDEFDPINNTLSEREYQLEGSSSVPPAFLPPRFHLKKNRPIGRTETLFGRRNWTRIAMTATAVTALLIGGVASVFYLTSQSQLPTERETSSKIAPPNQEEESQDTTSNATQSNNSISGELLKSEVNSSLTDASKHEKTEILLEQQEIESWTENKPILAETKVAVIAVRGGHGDNVKMVDGHEWFAFKSDTKEIYLKKTNGLDYEKTKSLQAKFECNEATATIQIAVTNINEPTLKINTLDDDGAPSKFAVVGQTVKVTTSGYINEVLQNSAPSFQWMGMSQGIWENLADAKFESYRIAEDCKFSNLKCCVRDEAVNETVESSEIVICPLGVVTIEIDELLRFAGAAVKSSETQNFPEMRIQIAMPELAPVKEGMARRFEFAGDKKAIEEAHRLQYYFETPQNSVVDQYKFPDKLFQRSVSHRAVEEIELNITGLIAASRACTNAKNQFKGLIRLISAEGEVAKALKEFFSKMDFPQNIDDLEDVDSLIVHIERLGQLQKNIDLRLVNNFDAVEKEIKDLQFAFDKSHNENTKNSLNILMEFHDLTTRFRNFEKAFPDFMKTRLKSVASLNPNPLQEIKLLGTGLQKSQEKSPVLGQKWKELLKTANDLKKTIDSMNKLDLKLYPKTKVSIWMERAKPGEGESNPKIELISVPQCFKLKVLPTKMIGGAKSSSKTNGSKESKRSTSGNSDSSEIKKELAIENQK